MKNALFVHYKTQETRPSEFATLAAIASKLGAAGFSSDILVIDTTGTGSVRVPSGSLFRNISAVAPDTPVGDGAGYILRVAGKAAAAADADLVVALGTIANRCWAPQLAASFRAEFLTSCESVDVIGDVVHVTAPAMGGIVSKSLTLGDRRAVLLFAGEALPSPAGEDSEAAVVVDPVDQGAVRFVASEPLPDTGGIPLRGATRVVSGGLGIGSGDKWHVIEDFAAKVDAAVGASRAAVEMGWVSSSRQVGFSGQKVSPDVYVAVGISGAVHHLAGIGGAKKIVAINKDPEANIFKIADVAIVGDYEKIIAAAMRKLERA